MSFAVLPFQLRIATLRPRLWLWFVPVRGCCQIDSLIRDPPGRDILLRNLKVDPYKYQFSRTSNPFIYQSAQFWIKFWAKSFDFSKIFLNLSQFWLKFEKILKNRLIHIPNFAFYNGSFIYQEADFATHVSGTSLQCLLYWVPPRLGKINKIR